MVIRSICVLLVMLCVWISVQAQLDNIWIPPGLNFNTNPVSAFDLPASAGTGFGGGEAAAMVCDASGQLLFFTDGNNIRDRRNRPMQNGNDLIGNPAFPKPTESTFMGTVIVPDPGNSERYYVFSLAATTGGANGIAGQLYYSIVDMEANGGLGAVNTEHKGIYLANGFIEGITAVTGDRCNIWLLARSSADGSLRTFEITEAGINTDPVISPMVGTGSGFGNIKVSPNRKKLLLTDVNYRLADFDPVTGKAGNMRTILPEGFYMLGYSVPEFSPDNSKMYANDHYTSSLYQFDLNFNTGKDIYNSGVKIAGNAAEQFKLGPDGKIYFTGGSNILGRINEPNRPGAACGIQVDFMPGRNLSWGGPNVVPFFRKDTFYTAQPAYGPCFANVNPLTIYARDTSGWDYSWHNGRTGYALTTDTPGVYWLSYYTPPCNFHVDTFYVSFPNGVLPSVHVDTACREEANGGAYTFTYPADTVQYYYTWMDTAGKIVANSDTFRAAAAGTYLLRVQTAACDTIIPVAIPAVDYRVSFGTDSIVCQNTMLSLHNTSDKAFTSFNWTFGDGQHSTAREPRYSYPHAGVYRLSLAGTSTTCRDTFSQVVVADSQFVGAFRVSPAGICLGEATNFYPEADSSVVALQWHFGAATSLTTPKESRIQHAFDEAGTQVVQLRLLLRACPDTWYTDTVRVYDPPAIDLGQDTSLCFRDRPITLFNRKPYRNGDMYTWSTGSVGRSITAGQPGNYSLTIKNVNGCSHTEHVLIARDCYTDIPNAFSPNGDGKNDYFFPRQLLSRGVSQFKLQVFNRWGQLLFETVNENGRGWDGRYNGIEQPPAVYLYTIEVAFSEGYKEHYQGNLTLVR